VCAGVHAEASSTTTETVALGTELTTVAGFAVKNGFVAVQVGRVQSLVAHAALETFLVELELSDLPCLCCVHRLGTLGALDLFWGFERHLVVAVGGLSKGKG